MKIIIIGCGMIGISHLKSLLNSNGSYEILIIDKKKRINELKTILSPKKNLSLNFNSKIPNDKNFDFAIISTNSIERYKAFKSLIEKNQIKFILLEKFIFSKIIEYKKFSKFFKKYNKKIMVNSFGSYLYKNCGIKKKEKKPVNIFVTVKEGTLFTGMIHYFDFFYLFTKKKIKIDLSKIKKIINSKRSNYFEGLGEINAFNSKGSIKISTCKKVGLEINFKIKKINYKIILKKNNFHLFKNNKFNKKFPFPFAYKITAKLVNNNKYFLKNFHYLSQISIDILRSLKKKYRKEIFIT